MAWASPKDVQSSQQHQETRGSMERALMGEVSGEYLSVPQREIHSFKKKLQNFNFSSHFSQLLTDFPWNINLIKSYSEANQYPSTTLYLSLGQGSLGRGVTVVCQGRSVHCCRWWGVSVGGHGGHAAPLALYWTVYVEKNKKRHKEIISKRGPVLNSCRTFKT